MQDIKRRNDENELVPFKRKKFAKYSISSNELYENYERLDHRAPNINKKQQWVSTMQFTNV